MKRSIAHIMHDSPDKVGHEVWISFPKREYASYRFRCRPGEVYEMLLRVRMSSAIGRCMAFNNNSTKLNRDNGRSSLQNAGAVSVNLEC